MAVLKVIEILSNSNVSWEDATAKGVARAAQSVDHIRSAFVQSQSVTVHGGAVSEYRVNLKITFEVGGSSQAKSGDTLSSEDLIDKGIGDSEGSDTHG